MNRLAIIPARVGSKGLKNKNILKLCGKPLMAYSIEAAVFSGIFNKIVCTTDSREYGAIAEKYGAIYHSRSKVLSDDRATTYMVVKDVINSMDETFDYFVLLQPTSPMRNYMHVKTACCLFESVFDKFDFLVSVKEAEHSSILVKPIDEDNSLKYFDMNFSEYRRQSCVEYSPNGAIFIGKPEMYLTSGHFFGKRSYAYKMSEYDSIDVDTQLDFELASICMKKIMEK